MALGLLSVIFSCEYAGSSRQHSSTQSHVKEKGSLHNPVLSCNTFFQFENARPPAWKHIPGVRFFCP